MTKHLIRMGIGLGIMAVIVVLSVIISKVPYADYIIFGLLAYYCGTVLYDVYKDRKENKDFLQK